MENNYLDISAQNVPQHNETVSDYDTNWCFQANNNVKIGISNSNEVKNTITLSTEEQDGNCTRSSWETSCILRPRRPHHGRNPLGKIGVHHGGIPQSLLKGQWMELRFGLPEHSTDRIHTRRAHNEHNSVFTSTHGHICAWLKTQDSSMSQLQRHLRACESVRFQVIHVIAMLVLAAPSLSQSATTRSTTWTARSLLQEHSTHPAQLPHHDLLREHPETHPAPFQALTRSVRIAASPLCDNEIQSGRTLRTTHSTSLLWPCRLTVENFLMFPVNRQSFQVHEISSWWEWRSLACWSEIWTHETGIQSGIS